MARLEIDDRAFSDPRLKRLANLLRKPKSYALGVLIILWHDSQEQLKATATSDEIKVWLDLTPKRGDALIAALASAGYIEQTFDQIWKIKGNERRLNLIKIRRESARNSATARWSKRLKVVQNPENEDAQRNADAMLRRVEEEKSRRVEGEKRREIPLQGAAEAVASAIPKVEVADSSCEAPDFWQAELDAHAAAQKSSVASEQVSGEARSKKKPGARKPEQGSGANLVIAAYMDAYREKFNGQTAELVGAERGAAKRLALDLGPERAVQLVRAYLQIDDEWFIKQEYRLAVLLQNVKKVGLFADQGVAVTGSMAKSVGLQANNAAVGERLLDRMRRREAGAS